MTRLPPNERPTAQELAAGAVSSGACPRCGCRDWRGEKNSSVESTRKPDGRGIVRRRVCRHCGQTAFKTEEVVVPEGHRLLVVPDEEIEEEFAA